MDGYVKVKCTRRTPFNLKYELVAYVTLKGRRGIVYFPGRGNVVMKFFQGQWILSYTGYAIAGLDQDFIFGEIEEELNRQLKTKVYEVLEE